MVKQISVEEVKNHNTRGDIWIIIHNKVYDVTNFIEDHPGGEEVLLEQAGKEATEIFEDVSHSIDAKDLMATYLVGELPEEEKTHLNNKEKEVKKEAIDKPRHFRENDSPHKLTWGQWVATVLISVGVGLLVRNYTS